MDSKERFSLRVPFYARSRPSYPSALVHYLADGISLRPNWRIADLGSGTGLLSRLFLEGGYSVVGIEPNAPMREQAALSNAHYPKFRPVDGSAEATTLEPGSVDLVVAGQAFHWFDAKVARAEFARICKPPAWCALIWNQRAEREEMPTRLQELIDRFSNKTGHSHRLLTDDNSAPLRRFFDPSPMRTAVLSNSQEFTFERLCDYAVSMSHMPLPGEGRHAEMVEALRIFFDAHSTASKLSLAFETRVFLGALA